VALKTAWPGVSNGSILLTSRDLTVATTVAAQHVQLDALGHEDGTTLLLRAANLENVSSSDAQHALMISQAFDGLPLALSQIGGFISQRRLPLQDFLPLYGRYAAKIDARKTPGSDYEHTLSSVWDVSFEKLTETSTGLLHLLSFLEPDSISEDILLHGSQGLGDEFAFLSDELEYVEPSNLRFDRVAY